MYEDDNSIEQFTTLFNKMFSETKYNLQALNKRMESMDKCFNNIMLLQSDKPFDEGEDENEALQDEKSGNLRITSKELDEIERMFREMEDSTKNRNILYINKKRNNKKYHIKSDEKNSNKKKKKMNEDEGSLAIDDLIPETKIEKYTKFKEIKNHILNNKYKDDKNNVQISEEEYEIDDDFDFDME